MSQQPGIVFLFVCLM